MGSCYRFQGILLSSFFIFSTLFPLFSNAIDTLTQGQTITSNQSLVSSKEIFELGFFTPTNSTNQFVGIWYRNDPAKTVVWVANRENPIDQNSNGSLTFGKIGNLVVLDGGGSTLWSTKSSIVSNNSVAQLLDSGNLVLRSNNGTNSVLWQSFDYPTDAFLPGMTMSLDRNTKKITRLTAWRSENDPRSGNYSLGLDRRGSAQIFIWEGSTPTWRSGQWKGQSFTGIPNMRPLNIYGFSLTDDVDQGKMSFSYSAFNDSLLKFVVTWDGKEETSLFDQQTKAWKSVWVQPVKECEFYGKCGKFGKCGDNDSPICSCLRGFEPASSEEWSRGNWSGGCVRRTQLQCGTNSSSEKGDGFFRLEGVKLPDLSNWLSSVVDPGGCQSFCLNNCSCRAYSYDSVMGCLVWVEDLIDTYQFSEGGIDLYVKLAASELDSRSKIWITIVVASSLGVAILIICIYLWWKCKTRVKEWWKKGKDGEPLPISSHISSEANPDFSGPSRYQEEGNDGKSSELPLFNFEYIATATSDFNDSNKLGQGGFGHVYKGILPGGEEVAVKRLSRSSGQGVEEFKNEVLLIAKLQHRNLVRLRGCCIQGEERILIYEYMPNKSLDAFLFNLEKQALLDWRTRFNIIEGIARGLLYLHRDSRLRIVHRDLKASNILLDGEMNPKISDFGMARIFGGDQNEDNTNRLVGTYGYMSPEYAMEGLFSTKSDIYSFGVLMLEIVSGRKNNSFHHSENSVNIVGYAWQLWNEDNAMELIDPSIRSSCSTREVLRCIHIGLLCVQDRSNDRPDISSIVLMLGSETTIQIMPKQPTFVSVESPNETTAGNRHVSFSTNDLTITTLKGR